MKKLIATAVVAAFSVGVALAQTCVEGYGNVPMGSIGVDESHAPMFSNLRNGEGGLVVKREVEWGGVMKSSWMNSTTPTGGVIMSMTPATMWGITAARNTIPSVKNVPPIGSPFFAYLSTVFTEQEALHQSGSTVWAVGPKVISAITLHLQGFGYDHAPALTSTAMHSKMAPYTIADQSEAYVMVEKRFNRSGAPLRVVDVWQPLRAINKESSGVEVWYVKNLQSEVTTELRYTYRLSGKSYVCPIGMDGNGKSVIVPPVDAENVLITGIACVQGADHCIYRQLWAKEGWSF